MCGKFGGIRILSARWNEKKRGTYKLECEMFSGRPLDETFAIFEDPYNLAKITPPWLNFRVTSTQRVDMRAAPRSITSFAGWATDTWKTRIAEYDPPQNLLTSRREALRVFGAISIRSRRRQRALESRTGLITGCRLDS